MDNNSNIMLFPINESGYTETIADPYCELERKNIVENRILWLTGEISDTVTTDFAKVIFEYNRMDTGVPEDKRKPIIILIDSAGGDLYTMQLLVDCIEASKTKVIGVSMSKCMSAAALILLACHKRLALRNSTIMLHAGSIEEASGSFREMAMMMENYQRQIEHMVEFIMAHSDVDEDVFANKFESDWYITTQEALDYKMIDGIVSSLDEVFAYGK